MRLMAWCGSETGTSAILLMTRGGCFGSTAQKRFAISLSSVNGMLNLALQVLWSGSNVFPLA